jgi:hypothetical protein
VTRRTPIEATHVKLTVRKARNESWRSFLEPLVGKEPRVSVAVLDGKLQELTDREGDARGEIYAYLRGEQAVGPHRAFWIGEALRECGVGWSSGVISLAQAGHLRELVALLAMLSTPSEGLEALAVIFAAACAILTCREDGGDKELVTLQRETRERLPHFTTKSSDLVLDAWRELSKKPRSYGRLFQYARPALRDAFASASLIEHTIRERRVFEDLGRWSISFAERDERLTAIVAPRFARRAEADQRRTSSAYQDAIVDLQRSITWADEIEFEEILRAQAPRNISTPRARGTRKTKKGRNPR